jgi:hypothetical protein
MSCGKWRRKAGACSAHIVRTLTGLLVFPTIEKSEIAGACGVE